MLLFLSIALSTSGKDTSPNELRQCATAHDPPNTCVSPGVCQPPASLHAAVATGPSPGLQWDYNGGFCGSFSVQQGALSVGAWISQDLVRKANRAQAGIPHNMHGDSTVGYEVMPSNIKYTADSLRLLSDEFDYTQPSPQAPAWKAWAKSHLVKKHPIVFFPMCAGDPHQCYPGSCPNGGHCDHVESMYGIYSNHSLDDLTVYDDDVIVHTSNQDCYPYYRPMSTLEDSTSFDGNCKVAQPGWGRNEMYPCVDESVTYGVAVTGINVTGTAGVTSMVVDLQYEPDVRTGDTAALIHPNISVTGLYPRLTYVVVRYVGTENLPTTVDPKVPFGRANCSQVVHADADGNAFWTGAPPFMSDQAVYHYTVAST